MTEEEEAAAAAAAASGAAGGSEQVKTVPYSRFQEVLAERNNLRTEQEQWAAKSAQLTELETKLAEKDTEITSLTDKWSRERTMLSAGLTDTEGQEIADFLYKKLQVEEGAEKPAFSEWLKFDGEDASPPKALAPYLAGLSGGEGGSTRVDPNAGAKGGKPNTAIVTNERIRAVREKAMKTGDWSEYKELRKTLGAK